MTKKMSVRQEREVDHSFIYGVGKIKIKINQSKINKKPEQDNK